MVVTEEATAEPAPFLADEEVFDKKKADYKLITKVKEAEELDAKLGKVDLFVYDTETDSLDTLDLNIVGASFSTAPYSGYFVAINPFQNKGNLFDKDLSDRLAKEDFIRIFKPVFENPKIKKVCQNAKFDMG